MTNQLTTSITLWYKRHECGVRMAIFFSAATAAGAFGGLLARGIVEMKGLGGLSGWQWIFVLEGILTIVVGKSSRYLVHVRDQKLTACSYRRLLCDA